MTEETTPKETELTEGEVPASLTVQDLANIRRIIDLATTRGAFRANEFTVVGATYTKLDNFIKAITPTKQQEEESTDDAATEETDTTETSADAAGEK